LILSVTGTINIEKFNRGFEENSEAANDTTKDRALEESIDIAIAGKGIKQGKRSRSESVPNFDIEERSSSRKPISLWFKKQLVLKTVKETNMDLPAYGYKGKKGHQLPVCLVTGSHPRDVFIRLVSPTGWFGLYQV
jgi:hypothetical protein